MTVFVESVLSVLIKSFPVSWLLLLQLIWIHVHVTRPLLLQMSGDCCFVSLLRQVHRLRHPTLDWLRVALTFGFGWLARTLWPLHPLWLRWVPIWELQLELFELCEMVRGAWVPAHFIDLCRDLLLEQRERGEIDAPAEQE